MTDVQQHPHWDPRSEDVLRDPVTTYDRLREEHGIAFSDMLGWSVFRHEDVVRVLHDPHTFSNVVSEHQSVPNGFDPPQHTAYRRLIDPYFRHEMMDRFEPICRRIATDLAAAALTQPQVEIIKAFAQPFAVEAQCAFLGWGPHMHDMLLSWGARNQRATFAQDRPALAALAREFQEEITSLIHARREAGPGPEPDVTDMLLDERVGDRPLRDEELVSIMRNWTSGEIGTIVASIGIIARFLADDPQLQQRLRDEPDLLAPAIDEILRIHGPLTANRRTVTRPVELAGRKLSAGDRITIIWIAANRDPRVFDDPQTFRLDRDPALNLLYGDGIHYCPGAPLARLELRIATQELLRRTTHIDARNCPAAICATYPAGGYTELPLNVTPRAPKPDA